MLTKQKNSPYWYAVIYISPGKKKWFSTKTTSKREAQVIHDELEAKFKKERNEKYLQQILGVEVQDSKSLPLNKIWKEYTNLKGQVSPTTQKNFNRFINWLKKTYPAITDCHEITKDIALEYIKRYSDAAPKTFNNNRSSLSSIWKMLKIHDVNNVWDLLPNKEGDSKPYRSLSIKEIRSILANSEGFWHYATIISYHTGLRLKDIALLKWSDVKIRKEVIEKKPEKTKRYKRSVYIHLHTEVIKAIKAQKKENKFVFPDAAKLYGSGKFNSHFPKILAECKIKDNKRGKASFHSLRASFITKCEEQGVDRKVIQGIVGHKSPAMTEHYSDDLESGKVIKSLPNIL